MVAGGPETVKPDLSRGGKAVLGGGNGGFLMSEPGSGGGGVGSCD